MIIKSKKFILRPYRKGDEESLRENINDKEIYRYTCNIPHPYLKKDAKEWINKNTKPNKKEVNFAVDINGKVVGCIGFRNIEKHKAEIGYWLGKKYWGKGIVSEALKHVSNFGFKNLKLKRIYAPIFVANKRSRRVLEKNKYKFEGKMKNYYMKDGKLIDCLLYAKTK